MCKCTQKTVDGKHAKQQWSKSISSYIASSLAKYNKDSPLKSGYDDSYRCASVRMYDGEKLISFYCRNRWCHTCNRIRTAVNISNYGDELSLMSEPCFVTLTRRTVGIDELSNRISEMESTWRAIYSTSKHKNGKACRDGIFLRGIRSMECTIRPDGKYHYHIHLIVEGRKNADFIVSEWIKRNDDAEIGGQDVRLADKGAVIELFKYAVKISLKHNEITPHYCRRLDALYNVLKGKRTLSAFGGIRVKKDDEDDFDLVSQNISKEMKLKLGDEDSTWVWKKGVYDWVNKDTGELFVNEPLPDKILNFIEPDRVRKKETV